MKEQNYPEEEMIVVQQQPHLSFREKYSLGM